MIKSIFKRSTISFIIVMLVLSMSFNISSVQAAPSTFIQTSWTGGQTANTANHTSNQSGWSEFSIKDTRITNTTELQLDNTYSTNIDFNTEADYIQENATSGTDFTGGVVTLHKTDLVATGGIITTVGNYKVHEFTTSGTFNVTSPGNVDFLVVGSGGSGGYGDDAHGGGGAGGAGGLVYVGGQNMGVSSNSATVAGASGLHANGTNSVFMGKTAIGGGRGASSSTLIGSAGGSGGGGCRYGNIGGVGQQPGSASGGYGRNGGSAYNNGTRDVGAGGGGGAGAVGGNAYSTRWGGHGGAGLNYGSIFGTGVGESGWFASGGGGGGHGNRPGTAPIGGGGNGGSYVGVAGVANTGGGGGGGSGASGSVKNGGVGGSGVVIVRYLAAPTYPTTPYYITTNNNSQKDSSNWQSIQGVIMTQTTPTNTNIKQLISFDGRVTWKYWNGSTWQTSTLANIQTNGMTKTDIEALTNTQWSQVFSAGTIDFASDLSTTQTTVTPSLNNIEINYTIDQEKELISNIYNTEESLNTINNISWNETLPSNTDIKFQLRTSSEGTSWSNWCGPDCSTTTYFTDPTGNESIDDTQKRGVDNQYFQYKVILSTTDGLNTPTLNDVSIQYEKLADVTIPNPDNNQIQDAVDDGYIIINNGNINATQQTQTQVQVTFQSPTTNAVFPANTTMTNAIDFNFENFITENTLQEEQTEHPNAIGAVRLGVPNTNLTFNQDVTVEIQVSSAYNNMELDVLSQLEGSSTWNNHTTCTVTNNICSFTTDHATTYIVNTDGTISGSEDIDINVEVTATLSLDCYDKAGISGDYTVTLGTALNPGVVTAGTPAVGQSICNVTTNDDEGYYLSVINDNGIANPTLTHTVDNYSIPEITTIWSETTKTTESWNAPTTKGLGFSVITFPQADTTHNTFNGVWTTTGNLCEEGTTSDDAEYAGLPETAQSIATYTEYNSTQSTTDICYKVDVSPSQPSGTYTGSVTYTATSDAGSYYQ